MSVVIHQQPSLYTPIYNPMRFVLNSTNSSQPNFNYVVDVYVSGVASYTRLLFPPHPTTGRAAPDISGTLESRLSYDLSHTTYGFQRCTNSILAYEVKFGEQYGASSGIATYTDLTVTGTKYAWNGVFSPFDFQSFTYTSHIISGKHVLTNSPTSLVHHSASADNNWLYFINDSSGKAYYADVNIYDANNNNLSYLKIENAYQASATYQDKLLRLACGTEDIVASSYTLVSGSSLLFANPLYDHYTVQITDYFGSSNSALYTFTKGCTSRNGTAIKLFWLNRLGGFDFFDFTLVRKFSSDIQTDTYQKNLGELSGTTWGYDTEDRGETVYNQSITDKMLAESDFVSDSEAAWLQELFESPEVYYHTGTGSGKVLPVNVIKKSYEKKTIANGEKCFNVQIEVTYANKRWTQRG